MDNLNYFSAATLVKQSAAQIKFYRDNPEKKIVTQNAYAGVDHQHEEAVKINGIEELRSVLKYKDIVIFASHDVITDKYVAEIKSVNGEVPEWYLNSSLLQVAFYKAILKATNGVCDTPKFRVDQGYEYKRMNVDEDIPYYLFMGDDHYIINDVSQKIIEYFYTKAMNTFSYEDARAYDSIHKFKHFEDCKKYFSYEKV